MQATAYKNGGFAGNWYALMACIFNAELTSDRALARLGVLKPRYKDTGNPSKPKGWKALNPKDVLKDYEGGINMRDLCSKYHTSQGKIRAAIVDAGGTIRKRGGKVSGQKKDRATIGYKSAAFTGK